MGVNASKSSYSIALEAIQMGDCIVTLGTCLPADSVGVYTAMEKANTNSNAYISYMHPIQEKSLEMVVNTFVHYEVGSEEGVLAMLAEKVVSPEGKIAFSDFFESLDIGYISAESSVGEEEIDFLCEKLQAAKQPILIIGSDVVNHKQSQNILNLILLIAQYSPLKVLTLSDVTQEESAVLVADKGDLHKIAEISEIDAYDGSVVYHCNHKLTQERDDFFLVGSKQFAIAARIQDGAMVRFTMDNMQYERQFKVDDQLKGTIAFNPVFDAKEEVEKYRYKQVHLEVVDV